MVTLLVTKNFGPAGCFNADTSLDLFDAQQIIAAWALAKEFDLAKASNQLIRLPGVLMPGELALVAIPSEFVGLARESF